MSYKIIALLYKYRTDFSTAEMSMNNYSEYGIREEDFDALASDLNKLMKNDSEDNHTFIRDSRTIENEDEL